MANNRMWLVHRSTGKRVLLAKYTGSEWWRLYDDLSEKLDALFEDEDNKSESFNFPKGTAYSLEYEHTDE